MISWLPLFHDMGMVGFLSVPMQVGAEVVQHHADGLPAHAAAVGGADGQVRAEPSPPHRTSRTRCSPADSSRQRTAPSTCSSVRYMWNGAEPVDPETMDALAEAGRPLRPEPDRHSPPSTAWRRPPSPCRSRIRIRARSSTSSIPISSRPCQRAVPSSTPQRACPRHTRKDGADLEGRVVDREGELLPTRGVGIIEVRGKAVTPGYVTVDGHKPAQDADGWLEHRRRRLLHRRRPGRGVRASQGRHHHGRPQHVPHRHRAGGRKRRRCAPGNAVAIRLDAGQKRESFAVAVETNAIEDPEVVKRIEREVVHAVVPRSVSDLAPLRFSAPAVFRRRRRESSAAPLRRHGAALLGN